MRLDLAERGWYSGGAQTFMQANEGLVQANVCLRNLLGSADQWRLTAEYGHRSSFDFAALFRLPLAGGGGWTVRPRARAQEGGAVRALRAAAGGGALAFGTG